MSHSKVIRSKKSRNVSLGQNFLLGQNFHAGFFSSYRYFVKVTTADFDMFLQV